MKLGKILFCTLALTTTLVLTLNHQFKESAMAYYSYPVRLILDRQVLGN